MFKRHVFRNHEASIGRYIGAYAVNYFLGLGALWAWSRVIRSPYIAGLAAIVVVSSINYFVLKFIVFKRRAEQS